RLRGQYCRPNDSLSATDGLEPCAGFALNSQQPPRLAPDPDPINFDRTPSGRQGYGSFAPVLRIVRPRLYLWKTQNQAYQEATKICKERPLWRLLWKHVFA